jgi:hypothetical protein
MSAIIAEHVVAHEQVGMTKLLHGPDEVADGDRIGVDARLRGSDANLRQRSLGRRI